MYDIVEVPRGYNWRNQQTTSEKALADLNIPNPERMTAVEIYPGKLCASCPEGNSTLMLMWDGELY